MKTVFNDEPDIEITDPAVKLFPRRERVEEIDLATTDGPAPHRQWVAEENPVFTIEGGRLISAETLEPRSSDHISEAPARLLEHVNDVLPEEVRYNHAAHLYNALKKQAGFDGWPVPFTEEEFQNYAEFLIARKVESSTPEIIYMD